MFWQLTIDANDPPRLARFWARALDYVTAPPDAPDSAWARHYRAALGDEAEFAYRLFDPEGLRPPIFFQQVPESKAGKNRLHLDIYPNGRDDTTPFADRVSLVEAKVAELVSLGATIERRFDDDSDPDHRSYFVVLHDPEGNEFCVS